ncbi:MAG: hypothetical protein ACOZQL_03370 [Myxococcota bacterium]
MTLSVQRLVLGSAPLDVEPPPKTPAAPENAVTPLAPSTSPDARALASALARRPELASRLPAELSPRAQLLYLVTHRELSAGLAPLTVPVGEHDRVRLEPSGALVLNLRGEAPIRLHNRHDDLATLLEGAQAWELAGSTDLGTLLDDAVHRFYARPTFDGGGAAANQRGGTAFTYATIVQVLVSEDPSQRGLECLASASVHLWKSMGLVPPGLSREEFEHRYTSIHGDAGGVRLGPEFNRTLRGGRSDVRLDAAATAAFANALREDDWAKLTGAAQGRYSVRALRDVEEVVAHFARGGGGVRTTWADGGHYFVLSGARVLNGEVHVNEDDSLRTTHAVRKREGSEPYLTPYDPAAHTRFWTLERR